MQTVLPSGSMPILIWDGKASLAGRLNVNPPVSDTLITISGGFGPNSNHTNSSKSILLFIINTLSLGTGGIIEENGREIKVHHF